MVTRLPNGVAMLRVETPIGRLILLSDRLSDHERYVAGIIAETKIHEGARAVLLQETEVGAVALACPLREAA